MAKKRKDLDDHDAVNGGTYRSNSSIDNPPTGEDENGQGEMFGGDAVQPGDEPDKYAVVMTVTLKPADGGKAISIPIVAGECPKERVCEMLHRHLMSERNQGILASIVGKQEHYDAGDVSVHTKFSPTSKVKESRDRFIRREAVAGGQL